MRMTCLGALLSSRPVVNYRNPIPIGSELLLPHMEGSTCGISSLFREPYYVYLKLSFFCIVVPVTLDIISMLHYYSMPDSGLIMPREVLVNELLCGFRV
jgi:hypothetical protein